VFGEEAEKGARSPVAELPLVRPAFDAYPSRRPATGFENSRLIGRWHMTMAAVGSRGRHIMVSRRRRFVDATVSGRSFEDLSSQIAVATFSLPHWGND
jgi:hypothetical protein